MYSNTFFLESDRIFVDGCTDYNVHSCPPPVLVSELAGEGPRGGCYIRYLARRRDLIAGSSTSDSGDLANFERAEVTTGS